MINDWNRVQFFVNLYTSWLIDSWRPPARCVASFLGHRFQWAGFGVLGNRPLHSEGMCIRVCVSVYLWPHFIGKKQCFAAFLPFRAPGSSFFWDFLFCDLLFSSLLFSYSAHLCFSSVHIVGSLTSKLPSIIYIYHVLYRYLYIYIYHV